MTDSVPHQHVFTQVLRKEGALSLKQARADERTRRALLLVTSALLAIWVRPKGLLAELRPPLPNAGTEATLNGGLVVAPTHDVGRDA